MCDVIVLIMGIIMVVVVVLLIYIDKNQVGNMRFNIKLKICNKCYIVYLSVIYNVVLDDDIEIKQCDRDVYRLG